LDKKWGGVANTGGFVGGGEEIRWVFPGRKKKKRG